MKKTLSIVLTLIMALAILAGCGGSSEALGCEGKYTTVSYTMMGVTLTGDDASDLGMEITLKVGGKGSFTMDGNTSSIKWKLDGEALIITVEGEEIAATLKDDAMQIEDLLDMGMDVTLALEGSAAADSALYLPEEEKAVIGLWESFAVEDVLGDDISDEYDPTQFKIELNDDHTGKFAFSDDWLDAQSWSMMSGMGSFDEGFEFDDDSGEATISFELDGDYLEVTYSDTDGEYVVFVCAQAE